MRSTLTRFAMLAAAGLIAAAALDPASAATRHKRAAPVQTEAVEGSALPIRPDWAPVPNAVWQTPSVCVTDEGYGRFTPCDQGGF